MAFFTAFATFIMCISCSLLCGKRSQYKIQAAAKAKDNTVEVQEDINTIIPKRGILRRCCCCCNIFQGFAKLPTEQEIEEAPRIEAEGTVNDGVEMVAGTGKEI